MMNNGFEFIMATDQKQYYMESFLKSIIYGYKELVESKTTYSRAEIHKLIKKIQRSEKAHNELEDFLCTDLVTKHIKPNLAVFGLQGIVVDNGVRESKENVTTGHLDIKFQVPSLSENYYYAFEAKRLDKNKAKQNYYLNGGIKRFTNRTYYPETNMVVAGMLGFVELSSGKKAKKIPLTEIKDSLNNLICKNRDFETIQPLLDYSLFDTTHSFITDFKSLYFSKHSRDDDKTEIKIYHIFLDYYDLLKN